MRKAVLPLLVAVLAASAGYLVARLSPPEPAAPVADTAPARVTGPVDFTLPDLDGKLHAVSEWRGKPLLVNFWATWCGPCREEIPLLVETGRARAGQLQILGVAVDNPDAVREFAAEFHIDYPNLMAERGAAALLSSHGNPSGALPYTLLLDAAGVIRNRKLGPVTAAEIAAWMEQLR